MRVSCNEIESMVLKAARGAGMSWGLAEEAAQAARWLAVRCPGWLPAFAGVLEAFDSLAAPCGDSTASIIGPALPSQELCPVRTGAYLSDLLEPADRDGRTLIIGPVRSPILMVPFVARVVLIAELSIDGTAWRLREGFIDTDSRPPLATSCRFARRVEISIAADQPATPPACVHAAGGVTVDPADWQRLALLERRTYVPASDASRVAGAGAGLTDND
jgi:hypothetical protein